jgi:hypothetical protein
MGDAGVVLNGANRRAHFGEPAPGKQPKHPRDPGNTTAFGARGITGSRGCWGALVADQPTAARRRSLLTTCCTGVAAAMAPRVAIIARAIEVKACGALRATRPTSRLST